MFVLIISRATRGQTQRETLTFQLQADEVGIAQVLQEDAVGGGGLKVEGDVGAGLAPEGGEVQVRGGGVERSRVPVVT